MTPTLRQDALACFQAAVAAVDPERLVRDHLAARSDLASSRSPPSPIHLVAVGKAAAGMARAATTVLGNRITRGVLILPAGQDTSAPPLPPTLRTLSTYNGGHPVPNQAGVEGAQAILDLATTLTANDLLLCLISGGGSALMTLPPDGVSLADLQATTRALLAAGATINELNAVRKHLDRLKGGRLARAAHPARVLALVLSDVVGDPLDVIASGPVSADPTTFADAVGVLERHGLWQRRGPRQFDRLPAAVRAHLERGLAETHEAIEPGTTATDESPGPGDPCFETVEAHIVGSNRMAAEAARVEAERRGYATTILSTLVTGEAREVGRVLAAVAAEVALRARPLAPPACLITAGETTVTVTGQGKGGRNQEVALGAAIALDELLPRSGREQPTQAGQARGEERTTDATEFLSRSSLAPGAAEAHPDILIASLGTDGIDGPTDAAGALATPDTVPRAREHHLDLRHALADNDAYQVFQALGDLIITGTTGTNVMDLQLVLIR